MTAKLGAAGAAAARRLLRCTAAHGYATKFLPLGGHEHMFWVFESAQKMKLLAFILLFSSHCEGSLESVYRKRAVPFMHTIFSGQVLTAGPSNLVESAVKTFIEKR